MAAHRASGLIPTPNVLVGRHAELRRLREAVEKRESLLIYGPRGAGKTAIVQSLVESLPLERLCCCIYVASHESVKDLARHIVAGLYEAGDPVVRGKLRPHGVRGEDARRRMRKLSSGQLKALIFSAAPRGEYSIFLDNFAVASRAMARFVRELIWRCRTPVYAIASGCTQNEIGYAWSLYFAREYQLHVGPLAESSAREVLEMNIRRHRLEATNLDAFRREVIHASGALPGAIEQMCALAADSRYRANGEIKLKVLYLDWLMKSGMRPRASGAA